MESCRMRGRRRKGPLHEAAAWLCRLCPFPGDRQCGPELLSYPPTAAFAIVEGALFGGGCGAVVGLIIALALICVRPVRAAAR